MKHFTYLITIVVVLIGCNQTIKKKEQSQVVKESIEKKLGTSQIHIENLKNTTPRIIISEYEQWQKLIETVITNDSLYRYEKNWQSGDFKEEILSIESQGLYQQINEILKKDFPRNQEFYEDGSGNTYFIHLKNMRAELPNIEVSFKNCKSKELEQLISVINKKLPEIEHIKLKGKNIVDNFVPADSIETWSSLKSIAKYNSLTTFGLKNIDKNVLTLLDSTKFGKRISKTSSLKSSYIVAVRKNIGKYYPCIILGEQYECDGIVKFLAVFMVDSTFEEAGDFELISGNGFDSEGEWDYAGTFKDSLLQIDRKNSYECYENNTEGISKLQVLEQFVLHPNGQIEEIKTDTIEIIFCR